MNTLARNDRSKQKQESPLQFNRGEKLLGHNRQY